VKEHYWGNEGKGETREEGGYRPGRRGAVEGLQRRGAITASASDETDNERQGGHEARVLIGRHRRRGLSGELQSTALSRPKHRRPTKQKKLGDACFPGGAEGDGFYHDGAAQSDSLDSRCSLVASDPWAHAASLCFPFFA
jgi:hypothetical protein